LHMGAQAARGDLAHTTPLLMWHDGFIADWSKMRELVMGLDGQVAEVKNELNHFRSQLERYLMEKTMERQQQLNDGTADAHWARHVTSSAPRMELASPAMGQEEARISVQHVDASSRCENTVTTSPSSFTRPTAAAAYRSTIEVDPAGSDSPQHSLTMSSAEQAPRSPGMAEGTRTDLRNPSDGMGAPPNRQNNAQAVWAKLVTEPRTVVTQLATPVAARHEDGVGMDCRVCLPCTSGGEEGVGPGAAQSQENSCGVDARSETDSGGDDVDASEGPDQCHGDGIGGGPNTQRIARARGNDLPRHGDSTEPPIAPFAEALAPARRSGARRPSGGGRGGASAAAPRRNSPSPSTVDSSNRVSIRISPTISSCSWWPTRRRTRRSDN